MFQVGLDGFGGNIELGGDLCGCITFIMFEGEDGLHLGGHQGDGLGDDLLEVSVFVFEFFVFDRGCDIVGFYEVEEVVVMFLLEAFLPEVFEDLQIEAGDEVGPEGCCEDDGFLSIPYLYEQILHHVFCVVGVAGFFVGQAPEEVPIPVE